MHLRRVVTGQAADGRSVFVSDDVVHPVTLAAMPGAEFHRIWGSDQVVELPSNGTTPTAPDYFPPVGGFRLALYTFGPNGAAPPADLDHEAAIAEIRRKLPGILEVREVDQPRMHTTDTVDVDVILAGEVWLELDDGAEVHLRTGDCVVQNGTRHAWHNRSSQPCTMLVAVIGAQRRR
ncbi:MAG TPA: cupin domain-containing protein [Candidatus Dormibacteraeota bacterium]|nr:cupin domain-containing protein [Candidatus Dormibacteraeota bacterium]